MKGDFARKTFNPLKHFTRVLMQQGRVQLDADWNEQAAILLHYLQALAADLIGPHGGPDDGFKVGIRTDEQNKPVKNDFSIQIGHYYVHGLLCENEKSTAYTEQQDDYPLPDEEKIENIVKRINDPNRLYLVYLDVWERHITYLEDGRIEDPNIREVALGGPDTATRAKLVQQVKVLPLDAEEKQTLETLITDLTAAEEAPTRAENKIKELKHQIALLNQTILKNHLIVISNASLRARAHIDQASADPCTISPEARYRGAENQLYRVEIHKGGAAKTATFKWSPENGSVVFPISTLENEGVTLKHLGRDSRFGLAEGDWVEIVDDDYILQNRAEPLLKVKAIDPLKMQVTLDGSPKVKIEPNSGKHPLLRRWDHKGGDHRRGGLTINEGAALIVEGKGNEGWLILEDGVQIQFQTSELDNPPPNQYRTGDYWLIPARTATGDVEWPGPANDPDTLPAHGVRHHYAPLAVIILLDGNVTIPDKGDLRRKFKPLWEPAQP